MNAAEFNTHLGKLVDAGIAEGVAVKKMGFETMIGILEIHKQNIMDLRKQVMIQAQLQSQPLILTPSGSGQPPKG